ncbi:MAG TPA: hypothetical protein VGA00_13620 [Acidiferrobacterales bacterium]
MTAEALNCWKCGAAVTELPRPLSRLAECPACRAELHVCRQCRHYDPRVAEQCREDRAEEVKDKECANFCDWFEPSADAYRPRDETRTRSARERLEGLFGATGDDATPGPTDPARARLDELFGGSSDKK